MKYFYHQEIFLPTRCVSAEAARVQEDAAGADLPDLEHHAAQLRAVVRHLAHLLLRVRGPALGHRQTGHTHIIVLQTINQRSCTITKKASTRAFSRLKAPTSAFTFKILCYKQVLAPW